jgi:hypothetical protein
LHLTNKNSIAYAEQAKKTSLLFYNNYWLNFQILELSRLEKDYSATNETLPIPFDELPEEANISVEYENIEPILAANNIPLVWQNEAAFSAPLDIDKHSIESQATFIEPTTLQDDTSFVEKVEKISDVSEAFYETTANIAENNTEPVEAIAEVELTQQVKENQLEAYQQDQPTAEMQDEDELPVDGDELPVDDEMKQVSLKIAENLSAIAIDSNSIKDNISFEPLHTSDYFASVGIKLSEEIKPSDKLGLQMKSFTQWLKTMKKVHADQLRDTGFTESQLNVQNDKTIQQLAEASNKDNMVVTEAMAEVLLQQGKIIKAIEVYEKLSLLDPSKKAYFAAKLNQLKG